ncbi:1262_t:CDS:2 [Funneliformis caledonium]|uniref:1262_t:CDS:1 n=1 Tax=Funneliformis caledonium TaxID=1117310 RepID=A0A9N8YVN6_9GLOM|nr:1262_t:CDS:2 [Funneliformis caledonium]
MKSLVHWRNGMTIDLIDWMKWRRKPKKCYNDDSNLGETFDGSASWWTQGLGHGNSKLTLTASYASGKNWANRVFYSDNGSTAMEVALKMTLTEKNLEGSYHGDTIGVMNASIPSIYNKRVNWYSPKGVWFAPPQILMKDNIYRIKITNGDEIGRFDSLSEIFSESRIEKDGLSYHYKQNIEKRILDHVNQGNKFGALIMEPIVMGTGGMIFVDPLYQNQLIKSVRSMLNIPIIFDEVFTGFWRLGRKSGAEYLNVNPDIAAYAKLLTGGLCPLAVTLTNEQIFNKFLGDTKVDALLHGHSYTAHPIEEWDESNNEMFSVWSKSGVRKLSCLSNVNGVFDWTILSIELNDKSGGGYGLTLPNFSPRNFPSVELSLFDQVAGDEI